MRTERRRALRAFDEAAKTGQFPDKSNTTFMNPAELIAFRDRLEKED